MRSIRGFSAVLLFTLLAGSRLALAGPYTMDRFAFGNSARVSVAGSYQLTGGAGMPLVQRSSGGVGGAYVLQSGFWAFPPSASTGAPPLTNPPANTGLLYSAPNPFVGRTSIAFELNAARHVSLAIFDLRGARIRTLVERSLEAGRYRMEWDGHSEDGTVVPAGIYWVQFQSGGTRERSRIVRLP
jgi:hypothetical protein